MIRKNAFVTLLILIFSIGCSGSGDGDADKLATFLANKSKWESNKLGTYEYLLNLEVDGNDYPEMRFSVVNGQYDYGYFTESGEMLDDTVTHLYYIGVTFTELFEETQTSLDYINTRYDSELGFINYLNNFADEVRQGDFQIVNITLIR